jgi:hypothetical protein
MLSQDVLDDAAMNIGQTKIPTGIPKRQFFMVDAHQVQERRMEVMHVDFVFRRGEPEFVGRSIGHPTAYATSSEPN